MPELSWVSDQQLEACIAELLTRANRARDRVRENINHNVADPFALLCLGKIYEIHETDDLLELQLTNSTIHGVSNAIGEFHQQILGQVAGFVNHDAGYDIESKEKKILAEIKNKHNTMSATTRRKVTEDLDSAVRMKPGYTGYLVIIIPKKPRKYRKHIGTSKRVYEIDGTSFYEMATGDPDALDTLFSVLASKLCNHAPKLAEYCRKVYKSGMAK